MAKKLYTVSLSRFPDRRILPDIYIYNARNFLNCVFQHSLSFGAFAKTLFMLAESILRNIRSVFSLLLSFFNILFIFWGKILNIFLYQPSFFSKALQKSVLNRVIGFISNCNKFCNIFFNNYYLLLFFCRILPESRCK